MEPQCGTKEQQEGSNRKINHQGKSKTNIQRNNNANKSFMCLIMLERTVNGHEHTKRLRK